jgi:hypothetical protein
LSEWENGVLQWGFKLNSTPATADTWKLKGYMLKVNAVLSRSTHRKKDEEKQATQYMK